MEDFFFPFSFLYLGVITLVNHKLSRHLYTFLFTQTTSRSNEDLLPLDWTLGIRKEDIFHDTSSGVVPRKRPQPAGKGLVFDGGLFECNNDYRILLLLKTKISIVNCNPIGPGGLVYSRRLYGDFCHL